MVQAITNANTTISQQVASFTSEADNIHNSTLDKMASYKDQYEPTLYYYDRM